MINNNKDFVEPDKAAVEPDKAVVESDKAAVEPDKVPVQLTVAQKAVAITDDLFQFYYDEKKSGKTPSLALLPRETVITLMKNGLKTGVIPINMSSQAIIKILRNKYGVGIDTEATTYAFWQEWIIVAAYTRAFLSA